MYSIKTSSSTGKSKVKKPQPIRLTEYSPFPRLIQTEVKVKAPERAQPVKIAQLLGLTNVQEDQKQNVKKRRLPERLGPCSEKKDTKLNEINNGTARCARRNLNFNEATSGSQMKNDKVQKKTENIVIDKQICNETAKPLSRKSLLLQPNSIKNKYLKKYDSNTNRCTMIPEKIAGINNNGTPTRATQRKGNEIRNHVLSLKKVVNNNRVSVPTGNYMNDDRSNCTNIINQGGSKPFQIHVFSGKTPDVANTNLCGKESMIPKNEDKHIGNPCIDIPSTKLVACPNSTINNDMISISREQFVHLERDLKHIIHQTEENLYKLKSTLTCISNILSTTEENSNLCPVENKVIVNKEVQMQINCKPAHLSEENVVSLNPENCTMDNIRHESTSKFAESNENVKENNENVEKEEMANCTVDKSFLDLENQLNITYSNRCPISQPTKLSTPVISKNCKRPLKEYLALKSSMSFLQTPDPNRFKSLSDQDNVDQTVSNKSLISRKVFMDLQNLYSDSPPY